MLIAFIVLAVCVIFCNVLNIIDNYRYAPLLNMVSVFINVLVILELFSLLKPLLIESKNIQGIVTGVLYIGLAIFGILFVDWFKKRTFVDKMTGCKNRLSYDYLLQSLQKSKKSFGVLFLDIDGLKITNDTLGHLAGDKLIIDVAMIIKQSLNDLKIPDNFFRIGGDEFVVYVKEASEKLLTDIQNKIEENVKEFNRNNDSSYSVSSGYAIKAIDEDIDTALCRADYAMYAVKNAKKKSKK